MDRGGLVKGKGKCAAHDTSVQPSVGVHANGLSRELLEGAVLLN